MLKYLSAFGALILCVLLVNKGEAITIRQEPITNSTESPVIAKSINGFIVSPGIDIGRDELTKRDAQVDNFSARERLEGKSYEPLPKYYRSSPSNSPYVTTPPYGNYDEKSSFTFPKNDDNESSDKDVKGSLNQEEEEERQPRSTVSSVTDNESKFLLERTSNGVGPRHNVEHASDSSEGHSSDYKVYEKHPYGKASGADGRTYSSEYDSGDAGRYGSGYYSNNADVIPFSVYGHNNGYKKEQHYAGSGGEYSYSHYPLDEHSYDDAIPKTYHHYSEVDYHHHPSSYDYSKKALFAKSFLIPLAGAAILGIAAALVSNPLFLQLGTVSGVATPALVGKRKRRAVEYKHKIGHLDDDDSKSGDDGFTEEKQIEKQIEEHQNHIERLNNVQEQLQSQQGRKHQHSKQSRHERPEVHNVLHPYRGYHHW